MIAVEGTSPVEDAADGVSLHVDVAVDQVGVDQRSGHSAEIEAGEQAMTPLEGSPADG